jgi:hypothetical protein
MIVKIEILEKNQNIEFAFSWKLKWVGKRWMKMKMFTSFFVILGLLSTMKPIVYWFKAFFHVKHVLGYLL